MQFVHHTALLRFLHMLLSLCRVEAFLGDERSRATFQRDCGSHSQSIHDWLLTKESDAGQYDCDWSEVRFRILRRIAKSGCEFLPRSERHAVPCKREARRHSRQYFGALWKSVYAAAAYVIASTGIALAAAGSALPRGVAAICGLCSGSLRYSDMPIPVDRIGNERENLTRSPAAALRLCAKTADPGRPTATIAPT